MRTRSKLALLAVAAWAPLSAQALNIFACEPEWAALARQLAPGAHITSATHAYQDPHYIEARPSLIARLRRADLAVCSGAALEAGWLPALQQRAANPAVQPGQAGMLFVAEQVETIGQVEHVPLGAGDVHPEGNPHLHLDPERMRKAAAVLSQRLAQVDPQQAGAYRSRYLRWSLAWQQRLDDWRQRARPLKGQRVVVQHSTFDYWWRWLGIEVVADLEPKPGVPPTPRHLNALVAKVEQNRPLAIVHSWYQDPNSAHWLAERTGIPVVSLPSTTMAEQGLETPAELFEYLLQQLLDAHHAD
ncbi:metal ABC transporter substrate-binding protein [Marinobacterium weihaiense]|uniref:Zinc ABC transporter substrate-binding protein n=1 Tax=Marinobacterium weihaiense TaxID=2851016 RepID=A0ABS6M905_9GAMM|nr:zinc ABC transporter substrate-binding protein [Marinobacterium weihaiense]MBV0932757.1 zinc ABC transporter substrate-binding protein [Marinobacterium weihaiense]